MKKLILFFLFLSLLLTSQELIVVGNNTFPLKSLSKEEIKDFYLSKHRFIEEEKILVMNFGNSNDLRTCFEKNILEKSKRSLERYWRRAYYKGKRPPKVVKSNEMLFSYLEAVAPSLGYCDANISLEHNVTVLFRIGCD